MYQCARAVPAVGRAAARPAPSETEGGLERAGDRVVHGRAGQSQDAGIRRAAGGLGGPGGSAMYAWCTSPDSTHTVAGASGPLPISRIGSVSRPDESEDAAQCSRSERCRGYSPTRAPAAVRPAPLAPARLGAPLLPVVYQWRRQPRKRGADQGGGRRNRARTVPPRAATAPPVGGAAPAAARRALGPRGCPPRVAVLGRKCVGGSSGYRWGAARPCGAPRVVPYGRIAYGRIAYALCVRRVRAVRNDGGARGGSGGGGQWDGRRSAIVQQPLSTDCSAVFSAESTVRS